MAQYFKNVWLGLYTVLVGMKITIHHLFVKNVTVQYPNVKPIDQAGTDRMPDNARNRLFMDYEDCNGCMGCSRACPVNAITLDTIKVTPGDDVPTLKSGGKRGLWVAEYNIDFMKCCFCGLCVDACPTGSVKFTTEFEYSSYDKENLKVKFSRMTKEEADKKRAMLAKFNDDKKKADAEKKAAEEAK
jgi:NADH-quinone oxidoreductase subunit I